MSGILHSPLLKFNHALVMKKKKRNSFATEVACVSNILSSSKLTVTTDPVTDDSVEVA